MELEVETAANTLRLSEIESAHLSPSARAKMEELFRQWLTADATRDLIHAVVADLRAGKALDAVVAQYAALAPSSSSCSPHVQAVPPPPPTSSDGSSPARSPKRPPNYQQPFSSGGSPNGRKKHFVVSLFGDELHGEQPVQPLEKRDTGCDVVMKEDEGESHAQAMETDTSRTDDVSLATTTGAAGDDPATVLGQLRKQIPKLYTPGEGRRGRLRGLSTDTITRKLVRRRQDETTERDGLTELTGTLCVWGRAVGH